MTPLLSILTDPNPLLRRRAAEVDAATLERLRRDGFLDRLTATMIAADGVGIAATQVGVASRIIVVLKERQPHCYVNPEITSRSTRETTDTEGCLSVPGVIGVVSRSNTVTVRARDARFRLVKVKCSGLLARIFQHEVDHLDGVLFIDRATRTASATDPGVMNIV